MTNTTKTLEELQNEGRAEINRNYGSWESDYRFPQEVLERMSDTFAEKVWNAALDACREKMPEAMKYEGLDKGMYAFSDGQVTYREEALSAIDSLRTGEGKE